jgi:hypothetical protein
VPPRESAISIWQQVVTQDPDGSVRALAREFLDRQAE